jgi:hypothetical protein
MESWLPFLQAAINRQPYTLLPNLITHFLSKAPDFFQQQCRFRHLQEHNGSTTRKFHRQPDSGFACIQPMGNDLRWKFIYKLMKIHILIIELTPVPISVI